MSKISQFYFYEAELLDDRRLTEWLTLLTDDIDYRIPTRTTRDNGSPSFSVESFHMLEDLASLTTRVRRFETDHAYAEDPRTRTRRIIGNIRPQRSGAANAGEFAVKSSFLLFRGKSGETDRILAGERHDTLRKAKKSLRLARRVVYLDHTVLPIDNLSVFL